MDIHTVDRPMSGYLRRYAVAWDGVLNDFNIFAQQLLPRLVAHCQSLLLELGSYKLHVRCRVAFHKVFDADETCDAFFSNRQSTILAGTNIATECATIVDNIGARIEEFCENGSDWSVSYIAACDLHVARYRPINASSSTFCDLPKCLANKKAIINVCNNDELCFKWAVLSALHPPAHNPQRVRSYQQYEHLYNFDNFNFPFTLDQLPDFEKVNNISIFVYGYENMVYPVYRPSVNSSRAIKLLLIVNPTNNKAHFCWIKNLDRLLYSSKRHGGKMYFCPMCLFPYTTEDRMQAHWELCRAEKCAVTMPSEENNILKFTATAKMLRQPCVFYADFECLICAEPEHREIQSTSSYTLKKARHVPSGFSLFQVVQCCETTPKSYPEPIYVERRPDAVESFLRVVLERSEQYQTDIIDRKQPMPTLTGEEWNNYFNADKCNICDQPILPSDCCGTLHRRKWCTQCRSTVCRDHCHICRRYRGPTHSKCNISYKLSRDVCVYLHNLKRYDGHLIMQAIGKFAEENTFEIECIPKGMDSYVMFSLTIPPINENSRSYKIKFMDTFQFLSTSLDTLVKNLLTAGPSKFKSIELHAHTAEERDLLLRKGVYPYEYMDDWSKFDERSIPAKEHFYSTISEMHISDEDYSHAKSVWEAFRINTMGQYHDLYLATDTLLLCDVFENFRSICMTNYKLDPAHFATLPSFGWSAVLKSSPVELQLLTDPDMYAFFEKGIRGGVSMVTTRFARANNPMLSAYDPNVPMSFIASYDANNLYGYSMSQPLPTSEFTWMSPEECAGIDVRHIASDAVYGCVLEVDLHYPPNLHHLHNDYPLAPEHLIVENEWLSPFCQGLQTQLNSKFVKQEKLMPTLRDKQSYVVHYENLKLYLDLGMVLLRVHRGIKFKQYPWMAPYIQFNTEQRKKAKSNFEKDLFKLLNNSVFGKSMENVRGYVDVKLITCVEKLRALVASPRFKRFEVFDQHLVGIMMNKKSVRLSKPIYVGFTVLESSKHLMYDFHYNFIHRTFPNNKLLFTDTDSLTYAFQTNDLYDELAPHSNLFDFSDYPPSHALHNLENKKIMGKMKDETNGVPIEEFVGLRSKMYSIKCKEFSKKRAKGVSKTIVKKRLSHEDYRNTLQQCATMRHNNYKIGNTGHQIFTLHCNKVSLSAYDDKRYILPDGVNTLAYGHFDIETDAVDAQSSSAVDP